MKSSHKGDSPTTCDEMSVNRGEISCSTIKPFLKWAGSKLQLLPVIRSLRPAYHGTYFEPFLGSGAVLLDWQPECFVASDLNAELINLYQVVRAYPKSLLRAAQWFPNNASAYQFIRGLDRDAQRFAALTPVNRAARMLYLNRTGFRGLYRVNRKGLCNTPYGHQKGPFRPPASRVLAASSFFRSARSGLRRDDFEDVLADAREGSFAYLDPPYTPLSRSANFTSYTALGFGLEDHKRLKRVCDGLHERGVKFLLSNAATSMIQELYKDYQQDVVNVHRRIKATSVSESTAQELLIRNYP